MLLFLAFFLKTVRGDCLDSDQLTQLGFKALEVGALPPQTTLCNETFSTAAICVNETALGEKLKSDATALSKAMDGVKGLTSFLEIVGQMLNAVAPNSAETAAQIASDLKRIGADAVAARPNCYKTLARTQMGTTCLLAAAEASANAAIDARGIAVAVAVSQTAERVEGDCLPIYDALCTMYSGQSLLYASINGSVPAVASDFLAFAAACRALRPYNSCSANATCEAEKRAALLSTLVFPYDYSFFPLANVSDVFASYFKEMATTVESFFAPRALAATSARVRFDARASGARDLYADGGGAGVPLSAAPCARIWLAIALIGVFGF